MFFGPRYWAYRAPAEENKKFGTFFFPIGPLKNFGQIPRQAAELIGGLLATELQSTQGYSVYGWMIFLCPISINSPTRLAGRGIMGSPWKEEIVKFEVDKGFYIVRYTSFYLVYGFTDCKLDS